MKKTIRFFFDWGAYDCFWGGEEDLIPYEWLGISEELETTLRDMAKEFQTALDWEYPPDPSPWSEEHKKDFLERAEKVYERILAEIGDEYEVIYRVFLPD